MLDFGSVSAKQENRFAFFEMRSWSHSRCAGSPAWRRRCSLRCVASCLGDYVVPLIFKIVCYDVTKKFTLDKFRLLVYHTVTEYHFKGLRPIRLCTPLGRFTTRSSPAHKLDTCSSGSRARRSAFEAGIAVLRRQQNRRSHQNQKEPLGDIKIDESFSDKLQKSQSVRTD